MVTGYFRYEQLFVGMDANMENALGQIDVNVYLAGQATCAKEVNLR